MEVSDHLHSPDALTLEKESPVPIQDGAGQGRRQGQSGRFGEEENKNIKPVGNRTADRIAPGSPIRGPPDCIMRSAATFVNCV